jgi:hypothetical protein
MRRSSAAKVNVFRTSESEAEAKAEAKADERGARSEERGA